MDIQVVLTENDAKLGQRGEVVKVSPGYAQNYLIPHKKAMLATPHNLKRFELEKAKTSKATAERLDQANTVAGRISQMTLTVEMMAGEDGKLFGGVTPQDIMTALSGKAVRVEKKAIQISEPIRKLGDHTVHVRLHADVVAPLKIAVVKKK